MGSGAPRIYYLHAPAVGGSADWSAVLDHCAGLGFDRIQLSPIFAPGPDGNVFVTADADRLHPALTPGRAPEDFIAHLFELCAPRGLSIVLDIAPARTTRGAPADDDAPDPRVDPLERHAIAVDFQSEAGQAHLDAWRKRIAALAGAGAGAFCFHGLGDVPDEAVRAFADAARLAGAQSFAWTPDLPHGRCCALADAGIDFIFSRISEAAGADARLVPEAEALRAASVIGVPEVPFGERLAARFAGETDRRRAARRALRLCAALADGLLVPMGFEFAERRPLHRADAAALRPVASEALPPANLAEDIRTANAMLAEDAGRFRGCEARGLTGPSQIRALLRLDAAHAASASEGRIVAVNWSLTRPAEIAMSELTGRAGAALGPFADRLDPQALPMSPDATLSLAPGEVRILEARMTRPVIFDPEDGALDAASREDRRVSIETVEPSIAGGFPVKRCVGDAVRVEADIFADGHTSLRAVLRWRAADAAEWREAAMRHVINDRWAADLPLERLGRHEFEIHAWLDEFGAFRLELAKKHGAGQTVTLELEEGRLLVESRRGGASAKLKTLADRLAEADYDARLAMLLSQEAADLMAAADPRPFTARSGTFAVDAERRAAGFASWYELFPRSQAREPGRHGTFEDVIARLPAIRGMGFDVLYFPPVHPIGQTNRKGRNNSLAAEPGDPGSPYAIGSAEGGHDALHPELGTLEDFRRLIDAAAEHGMEIALDFAIQCSPDHPWLKEHPDWFDWRPDGTIRYAENPPKRYEDIVNVDFYASGAIPSLWLALRDVVLFWVEQGVRLFRVDNPHTKPFPFWEWMIADVRARHPDAVFLAEAFTRPKVMYRLAKIGFSQSYTYFTWRTEKWEIEAYLNELTRSEARHFFRPHFFVNTPDINPPYLQGGERSAHLARLALATTLSGLWGMYNGFEICEARPVPGKEEYLDSEKYEIRHWDWDRPGNIVSEITRLNRLRRENPALQSHLGVEFHRAHNENVLFFSKRTGSGGNTILVAVNLAPTTAQEADVELPFGFWDLPDHGELEVEDLMRDTRFAWRGRYHRIRLDPDDLPFALWRVSPAGGA